MGEHAVVGTDIEREQIVQHPLDVAVANPWTALRTILDDPLHPGGAEATEDLLDRAGVARDTRLFDVGCGSGEALAQARQRGALAVGLDRHPRGKEILRGDICHLPIRDTSFDVVLAECVLCLSSDLSRSVAEIRRVLNPGGRLALSDVVVEGAPPAVPDSIAEMLCLDPPRELDELTDQLERVGFEIDNIQNHRDDLLETRERIASRVDYEGLLGAMGDRGQKLLDGIKGVEAAIESDRLRYVSLVASL